MVVPYVHEQVQRRLQDLYERHLPRIEDGTVASFYESGRGYYGPEEAGDEHDRFAVCIVTAAGETFPAGEAEAPFPLQSISKVFTYGRALEDRGRDHVLARVGVEPSGDAFHSIIFDERNNRPYNPMVNAGALVTTNCLSGEDPDEKVATILGVLRRYAGNPRLRVNPGIFEAEMATADRNRATAYLMRSRGMLSGDVETLLAMYLQQCSVEVTCRELALMAATLANEGVNPRTGERALTRARVRDVLSVMHTCGMYDFAGQWAYEVGVPAKSGVSGGIMAVIPDKMGIAVFSPGLDAYGNSVRGVRVCEEISERLGLHVFAPETEDVLRA